MILSDNMRGAVLMNIAMLAFTLNDTAMKAVSSTMPLFQAITLRGLVTTAALLAIAAASGPLRLWPTGRDGRMNAIRTLAEVLATLTFLVALTQMPLANLSAIMQSLPLAVTLAAALVFRDQIGWRRLLAIAVGFCGVLLIIKPGTDGFDRWSMLGLASVACVVVRDLATREVSRNTASATVAVWASLAVTLMGVVGMIFTGWAPVSLREALLILAASANLIVGYMSVVMVMRVGDIGFVAPFRYMALFWAILMGFLIFGSLPDGWTVIGAAIVVATGIFTLWRERHRRGAAPLASALSDPKFSQGR
ncbi:DMT family transporter [Gemmobacter fulvus]|uniref:DMT family transporter n=1 Tax=Gemmobacter fulvus TaxID=2840474 RepID=UPI002796B9C2|nr:DMT family transporter [Gemmobacter fulvus]MDQ1847215.1 DMT family transporter [Gemmobacter fulvus]